MIINQENFFRIIITASCCIYIGVFFIISAAGKLADIQSFIRAVKNYQIVSNKQAIVLGYILPIFELLLGVFFISYIYIKEAVIFAVLLLFMLTSAIVVNLLRGRFIECGCHGTLKKQRINWGLVARNIILMLIAVLSFIASNGYIYEHYISSLLNVISLFSTIAVLISFYLITRLSTLGIEMHLRVIELLRQR